MDKEKEIIDQMYKFLNTPYCGFSREDPMTKEELEKVKKIIESPPKKFKMKDIVIARRVYINGRKLDYESFKIYLKRKGIKL